MIRFSFGEEEAELLREESRSISRDEKVARYRRIVFRRGRSYMISSPEKNADR